MRIQGLSPHIQQYLDDAFNRMLQTVGGLPNLSQLVSLTDSTSIYSGGSETYWVDCVNGNDNNLGSQSQPFATINRALDQIPLAPLDRFIINVNAGTYHETLDLNYIFSGLQGCIDIVGQSWLPVTPTTGISSGTFDASFGSPTLPITASVTGAGWTASDLRGKFVQITSGSNNGKVFPIADNTATTIDFAFNATGGGGYNLRSATFNIVTPGVIVVGTPGWDHIFSINGSSFSSFSTSTTSSSNGVRFSNMAFNQGTGFYTGHRIGTGGNVLFQSCYFGVGSNSYAFLTGSGGAKLAANDSYLELSGSGGGAILLSPYNTLSFQRVILNGGANGIAATQYNGAVGISFTGVIQNQSSTGISLQGGGLSAYSGLIIRNVPIGVEAYGGAVVDIYTFNAGESVITNVTNAIVCAHTGFGANEGAGNRINLVGVKITNCSGDGIAVQGSHNTIDLGASTITNCTGKGVNLGASAVAGLNQCLSNTGLSMSSNTGGDFSIDGTTTFSLANLRAAPNKAEVENTLRLSRVIEP